MSLAVRSYKINEFVIQSLDGKNSIDISNSILSFDYFEDLLSPCITAVAQIMNATSLFNLLPIRGGEKVSINVSTAFGDFILTGKSALYVDKVIGLNAENLSESFTLNMVSREAFTNETSRCEIKYKGNIKDSVIKILKDDLKTDKYSEDNIERTFNDYSFFGNNKKPFNILTWLGPKSVPATSQVKGTSGKNETGEAKGTSGFLFYENKNGFNFRSIDSLVSQTKIQIGSGDNEDIPIYSFTGTSKSNDPANEFKILNYFYEKNNDLIRSLRIGMYVNKTYFYDLHTNTLDIFKYNLKNEIQNKLGADDTISISDEFGDSISRVMVRVNDRGVVNSDGSISTPSGNGADMAKSYSRYNLLFTQAINMVIPCNVSLYVGRIIKCEFPRINRATTTKEMDDKQSGLYLIKELRHHFEGGQMITSLRIVRDSYGLYGPKS